MDLAVAADRRLVLARCAGGHPLAMAAAQSVGPGLVHVRFTIARRLDHGGERERRSGQQLRLAAPVVDQLARGIGDADEAGVRKHRRRAVADLVVELAADHQHDVGFGHGGGAHGTDESGMVGRHQAAAFLGIEIDGAAGVEQPDQLGAGLPRAAAGDDQRTPRRPDDVDRLRHRGRLGQEQARRLRLQPLVEHQLRRHRCAQNVGRDLDIDRAGLAQIAHRPRHRLVELAHHLLGDAGGARRARHRPQNIDVRDVLQRTHIGLRARRATADQQHRRARERGIGHGRDRVGHARTGRHHGHAEPAGELGMGMRHMNRGAFVPDIDDANAAPGDMIPDRLDVAALQTEDAIDAALREKARDPGGAGELIGVQVGRRCPVSCSISRSFDHAPPMPRSAARGAESCRWPSSACPPRG